MLELKGCHTVEHQTSMEVGRFSTFGGCCGLPPESYQQAWGGLAFTNCVAKV